MPNDIGRDPLSYMGAGSATAAEVDAGLRDDVYVSPLTLHLDDASTTSEGVVRLATIAESQAGTAVDIAITPAGLAAVAIAGAPAWSEVTPGILERASTAEAQAGVSDTVGMSPLKTFQALAAGTAPGSFTTLAASAAVTFTSVAGAISMTSDTASSLGVTGAGIDLTLDSAAGRVVINGEEAAADAVRILSAAGGLDVDVALQMSLVSSQNAASAIVINATAGGIDMTAAGAAGEDIDLVNTSGSINLTAGEAIATSMVLTSSAGGIDVTAAGGAGLDIDITNTAGSIRLTAGEAVADAVVINSSGGIDVDAVSQINIATTNNAVDAIVLSASAGGIDILATGAATEDIDIVNTGGSVNITATENVAEAIYIRTNGGVTETLRLHADQGTGVASINIGSDVGGITIAGGLGTADAVNITASTAGGGIDIDANTGGFIVDTTGGISLDSAAASNFTATGAFDITIQSTAGSILVNAGEAVADAINVDSTGGFDLDAALQVNIDSSQAAAANSVRIIASAADGGMDIDSGTGGMTLDTTGALSLDSAAASNFTVTGAFDLTLNSTAGSVVVTGAEAAVDAIDINASNAAGGIDVDAGTGGITIDTTGALSLDSAAASNFTVTGAFDLTLNSTLGSVNLTAGEVIADSMVLTNNGIDIVTAGAAGRDIDITNTGGSINMTATESIASAIVINASGAAGGVSIDAGTSGLTIGTGMIVALTAVAAGPYAVLGTDYVIAADTGGGAFQIDLPAAPATGRTLVIYDAGGAAAGANITISGNGNNIARSGATAATAVINSAYESFTMYYNGTIWLAQNVV